MKKRHTEADSIIKEQYKNLEVLYKSTNGINWTNDTNWLRDCDYCTWYGVYCDADKNVVSLGLDSNNLTDTLPSAIGSFPYLEDLYLGNNELTGNIPPEIGNISSLYNLGLSDNNLTGNIPPEIGSLSNLSELYLSNNQLSGELPEELCDLENLSVLLLSSNQLSGCYPACYDDAFCNLFVKDFSNNPQLPEFSAFCTSGEGKCGVSVYPRAFLAGNYDFASGLMYDSLRNQSIIPLVEPYTNLGYNLTSGISSTVLQEQLDNTGTDAIVDWVYVELRDEHLPDSIIASRPALLLRNGEIRDFDRISTVFFERVAGGKNYYLSIGHRNHLNITTANHLLFSDLPVTIDFTTASTLTWGTNARYDVGGIMMMWAGDASQDGQIIYQGASSDLLPMTIDVYSNPLNTNFQASYPVFGYFNSDCNMDGKTIYQGAASDILPITISVYSNSLNTNFQASYPVFEQEPE